MDSILDSVIMLLVARAGVIKIVFYLNRPTMRFAGTSSPVTSAYKPAISLSLTPVVALAVLAIATDWSMGTGNRHMHPPRG